MSWIIECIGITTPIDIIETCELTNNEQQKIIEIEKKYTNYNKNINTFSFLLLFLNKIIINILTNKYSNITNYIIKKNCLILIIFLGTKCIMSYFVCRLIQYKLSSEWKMLYTSDYTRFLGIIFLTVVFYFIFDGINDVLHQQLFLLGYFVTFEIVTLFFAKIPNADFIVNLMIKIHKRKFKNNK